MKREFLGEILQTIYLDICIRDDSYIYVYQNDSEIMTKFRFIEKRNTLREILWKLENVIHPRYTKVIVDSNPNTTKLIIQWIDEKYNKFVPQTLPIIREDTMLEMVQVVKYHPKRIDIKKFMENKKSLFDERF